MRSAGLATVLFTDIVSATQKATSLGDRAWRELLERHHDAKPGEVLVSSTVKDLVAGAGLSFEDRGVHELKGIPGEWRLLAVTDVGTWG